MPFGIFKLSKKKEAAWEVLKWMAAPYEAHLGVQEVGHECLEKARATPMLKTRPQVASVLEATLSDIAAN